MEKETGGNIFKGGVDFAHKEAALPTDWSAFMDVVRSRRSVRVYTAEPVDEEAMRECLQAAHLAPSSSNLHPWEFYWVRSPQKKTDLVKACLSQPAAKTAQELVVCVARTDTWRRNRQWMLEHFDRQLNEVPKAAVSYYKKIVPLAYSIGPLGLYGAFKKVVFSFLRLFRPVPMPVTSKSELKLWAVKSTALACENFMLAVRAHGYDSCPMEGMDERRVRQILGLPKSAVVTMVISVGRRSERGVYGPQIRFSEDQFLFEV